MKIIEINKNKIDKRQIKLIVDYLLKGKVIILPTDTVYGLSCLATNKKSVDRIYETKERPKTMPLIVLIKSYCMLHDYFVVSKKQDKYIRSIWPKTTREAHNFSIKNNKKPTTFILKDRGEFADHFADKIQGVGARLPKSELLIKIIKKINIPLVSTSLNISGKPNILSVKNLDKYFQLLPDLVVDVGVSKNKKESCIIDIRDLDNIKIIRK